MLREAEVVILMSLAAVPPIVFEDMVCKPEAVPTGEPVVETSSVIPWKFPLLTVMALMLLEEIVVAAAVRL